MKGLFRLFTIVIACWLVLPAGSQAGIPDFMIKKMGTVSGQIFVDNEPVVFSIVSFFLKKNGLPPLENGMRRVPEFLSRTNSDGKFMINILAGEYYIGILIREPGAGPGPPREDEKFFYVSEVKGELSVKSVKEKEVVDLGRLDGAPPGSFRGSEEYFTVQGVVRDENGTPYQGVVVLGKSRMNIPRPEFISKITDQTGSYLLQLPASKPFYLVARETIADAKPRPGSFIGTYGINSKSGLAAPSIFSAGSPPPGVVSEDNGSRAETVVAGRGETISGADIYMYAVPDPEKIKEAIQGTINSPRFEKGAVLNDILFHHASDKLDRKSFPELDMWVVFLKSRSEIRIELQGHTDNMGNQIYNRRLSDRRAQAVADYLIGKDISADRFTVRGFGADQPVASNETPEGRNLNRRVEIKFVEAGQSTAQSVE